VKRWRLKALHLQLAVLLTGLMLTAVFVRFDQELRQEELTREAQQTLSAVSANIHEVFYRRFFLANSLEAFVSANRHLDLNQPDQQQQFADEFDQFTRTLDDLTNGVLSMQIAPGGIVRYVSNVDRNSAAIGHDLLVDDARRDQVLRAIRDRRTIVDGPLDLLQGGNAIIARKAIFVDGYNFEPASDGQSQLFVADPTLVSVIPAEFWGLVTVLIDTETVFAEVSTSSRTQAFDIALRGRHGLGRIGEVIYGDEQVFNDSLAEELVVLPDGAWLLAAKNRTPLYPSTMVILIGLSLTLAALFAYRLHEKTQLAHAASQAKSDFLAVISHEIRTPLNGIIGVASVLEKNSMDDRNRELVDIIMLSSKSLLTLVSDILDFSKIESGKFELENRAYSLRDNVKWISMLVQEQLREKPVKYELRVSPEVSDFIIGDEKRINQILLNLLNNAVKFTERGFIRLDVSVQHSASQKSQLCFKVSDSGIGIEKTRLVSVFSAFTQASTDVTRNYGGTGLGLTIVKRLSEFMGGTVTVESEPGKGSVFTTCIDYLPVVQTTVQTTGQTTVRTTLQSTAQSTGQTLQAHDVNGPEGLREQPAPRVTETLQPGHSQPTLTLSEQVQTAQAQAGSGQVKHTANTSVAAAIDDFSAISVLVVEDNKLNQQILNMMLQKLNATADFADDGEIALEKSRERCYDLIFMDSYMPVMDGLTTASKIRERDGHATLPWIVSVTASVSDEHQEACLSAGMNDFISKPLTVDSVRVALKNYLNQRSPDSK
jgi:signal transduction histidine kinase/ActR/RegA family two-component response regulator